MSIEVQLQGGPELRAKARNPSHPTRHDSLPFGIISLPGYPRVGDHITWQGDKYRVVEFLWFGKLEPPLLSLEDVQ